MLKTSQEVWDGPEYSYLAFNLSWLYEILANAMPRGMLKNNPSEAPQPDFVGLQIFE